LESEKSYAEGLGVLRGADIGKQEHAVGAETTPLHEPEHYQYDLNLRDVAEVSRLSTCPGLGRGDRKSTQRRPSISPDPIYDLMRLTRLRRETYAGSKRLAIRTLDTRAAREARQQSC